ncbi:RNA polymerase factor sigma-54 [Halobacillus andaensis]|uniref:RNA polymerase factor sigma-54 n=1 Tax=Halobacillus andaensis TaxID=1176239 RepID=UPI003D747AF3
MKLSLQQKQTTQLKMTSELRQAISLLQYSHQEIIEFINEQVMENPLLEIESSGNVSYTHASTVEYIPAEIKDWRQYLVEQAGVLSLNSLDYYYIKEFILNLNDEGFLPYTDHELAVRFHLEEDKVKWLRMQLKDLEPEGIGAYDFKDYLIMQVHGNDPQAETIKHIIQDYLPDVAAGHIEELAEKLSLTVEEVQESVDRLKELKPRPKLGTPPQDTYIVPDFLLEEQEGEYVVSLNRGGEPSVYITSYNQKVDEEGKEFLNQCYKRAVWLLRSIDKRRHTMLVVAQAIIDRQTAYLNAGEEGSFTPLTLKKVADEVNMHESTVSRAIADKYVKSRSHTFRLDQFFTSSLEAADGKMVSSKYVKDLIEQMINQENKRKPLSDQVIANHLHQKHCIAVSRRTVAKYREAMGILSSPQRKLK